MDIILWSNVEDLIYFLVTIKKREFEYWKLPLKIPTTTNQFSYKIIVVFIYLFYLFKEGPIVVKS